MSAKSRPTVVIGLGATGAALSSSYAEYVRGKDHLALISAAVLIESDGLRWVGQPDRDVAFEVPDFSATDYARWRALVDGAATEIVPVLKDALRSVVSADVRLALDSAGIDVDQETDIVIVAGLFDPIGSAAIVPVLAMLQALHSGQLLGKVSSVEIIAMWPDLFEETRHSVEAFARSGAAMQEINRAVRLQVETFGADLAFGTPITWLLSGSNIEGTEVGNLEQLLPMVLRALAARRSGQMQMGSYLSGAEIEADASWGSFGLCELSFNVDSALDAVSSALTALWADGIEGDHADAFQRGQVVPEVTRFLHSTGLTKPLDRISVTKDGAPIYQRPPGDIDEGALKEAGQLRAQIATTISTYESSTWLSCQSTLGARFDELALEVEGEIASTVAEMVDNPSQSAQYAHAFLQTMTGGNSPYLSGEAIGGTNLSQVSGEIQEYFAGAMGLTSLRDAIATETSALEVTERMLTEKASVGKRLKSDLKNAVAEQAAKNRAQKKQASKPATPPPARTLEDAREAMLNVLRNRLAGNLTRLRQPSDSPAQDSLGEPVAITSLKDAIAAVDADMRDLKSRISAGKSRLSELRKRARGAELSIADASELDATRERILSERQDEIGLGHEIFDEALFRQKEIDAEYAEALAEWGSLLRKLAIEGGVIIGITLIVLVVASLVANANGVWGSWLDLITAVVNPVGFFVGKAALIVARSAFWIGLVTFLAWGVRSIKRTLAMRKNLNRLEDAAKRARGQVRFAASDILRMIDEMYAFDFRWIAHTYLKSLISRATEKATTLAGSIAAFLGDLESARGPLADSWASFEFASAVFSRPVSTRARLAKILAVEKRLPEDTAPHLRRVLPYSEGLNLYRTGGIDALHDKVREYCDGEYAFLQDVSVEGLLSELATSDPDAERRLVLQIAHASQPFTRLAGDASAMSDVVEHAYLGVSGGDSSKIYQRFREIAVTQEDVIHNLEVFTTSDRHRATLYRFLVGLRPTDIGLCTYAMDQVARHPHADQLYADSAARSENLLATAAASRTADDVWEVVTLARAFEVLVEGPGGVVTFENDEYAGMDEVESRLRAAHSKTLRRALEREIKAAAATRLDALDAAISSTGQFDDREIMFLSNYMDRARGW